MSDNVQLPCLKFNPDYAVPPGETLKEVLAGLGMSWHRCASQLSMTFPEFLQLLGGVKPIDADLAKKLEHCFGTPASFWINREQAYRKGIKRDE